MELHVYRFDGLHLAPISGAFVHGSGIVRQPIAHVVTTDPPHDDAALRSRFALIIFDLVLNGDDAVAILPNGETNGAVRTECRRIGKSALETSEVFTRAFCLAHGSHVDVKLVRGGKRVVSRIRFNDGAVRHTFVVRP